MLLTAAGALGGLTLVLGPEGDLVEAAEHHFRPGTGPAKELGAEALARGGPLVQELSEAGRLAATPLRARQRDLGALQSVWIPVAVDVLVV